MKQLAGIRRELCKAKPKSLTSAELLGLEAQHSARNYDPMRVMFDHAKGCIVWDADGKQYIDFLSAYGAVSQGHVHPRITKVAQEQLGKLTLSSRAFCSAAFAQYAEFITRFFGYEKVLPMNTGAEGVETALKLARKWGYTVKGIAPGEAVVVCVEENFHGRTLLAISLSDDPDSYSNYGPGVPGILRVPFGDSAALEKVFAEQGRNICAFICEPIQGEAGIKLPPPDYLQKVRQLCTAHNILYVDDEVQTGIGRTGAMLAVDHVGVRPDVVILAKALGGGVLPVAAVLADKKYMDVFEPGTHGSTFGGNPLACAVATEALKVIVDECLVENSAAQGAVLLAELEKLRKDFAFIRDVRGLGLFAAIEFDPTVLDGYAGKEYGNLLMANHGVLTKVTHKHILRLTPPLCIDAATLQTVAKKLRAGLEELQQKVDRKK